MKRVRDKRGLDIKAGDTLVGGDGYNVLFIEVYKIDYECGAVYGTDQDDNSYTILDPHGYVSICACYRDARCRIAREIAGG